MKFWFGYLTLTFHWNAEDFERVPTISLKWLVLAAFDPSTNQTGEKCLIKEKYWVKTAFNKYVNDTTVKNYVESKVKMSLILPHVRFLHSSWSTLWFVDSNRPFRLNTIQWNQSLEPDRSEIEGFLHNILFDSMWFSQLTLLSRHAFSMASNTFLTRSTLSSFSNP